MSARSPVGSVESMSVEAPRLPCFLVEWYRPQLTGGPIDDTAARLEMAASTVRDEGASVRLLMTLAVPAEEVLFGVFTADSSHAVSEVCLRAGFPAERLTDSVDARVAG
jgi:hypothetical protein